MKLKGKEIVQVQGYQRLLAKLWFFLLTQAGLFVLGPINAYTQTHTAVDVSRRCQKDVAFIQHNTDPLYL